MCGLELTRELGKHTGKAEKDKEGGGRVSSRVLSGGEDTCLSVQSRAERERTEDDTLKADGLMPFRANGRFRRVRAKVGAISRFALCKLGS